MDTSYKTSYTAKLAYDQARHSERTTLQFTLLNLFPKSSIWSRLLGCLSFGTGLGVTTFLMIGWIFIVPSMIFSKFIMRWPSALNRPQSGSVSVAKNTSTTAVGSLTALKTFAARSQMAMQNSGGPDFIAPLLMRHVPLLGPNIPGSQLFAYIYLLLSRCHYYLTGRIFVDQLTEFWLKKVTKLGEIACLQARTCWLDDVVDTFAEENEGNQFNVVILGAGFDTRCYRLKSIMQKENVHLFEVDASGTQHIKLNALKQANIQCKDVSFVSCDFEYDDWMKTLQSQSYFNQEFPTVFVWEGVSMYLELDIVKSTISKIVSCGPGSCIAFDYMFHESMNDATKKAAERIGEPWKCTMDFDEIECIVADCQKLASGKGMLRIKDHLRKAEMKNRYLAKYIDGSFVGYLEEFGAFCLIGT